MCSAITSTSLSSRFNYQQPDILSRLRHVENDGLTCTSSVSSLLLNPLANMSWISVRLISPNRPLLRYLEESPLPLVSLNSLKPSISSETVSRILFKRWMIGWLSCCLKSQTSTQMTKKVTRMLFRSSNPLLDL